MEKLKRSDLFGASLVTVRGRLVERYNKCLTYIGATPTKLDSFHIDAVGWSPEIAEEKAARAANALRSQAVIAKEICSPPLKNKSPAGLEVQRAKIPFGTPNNLKK